MDLQQWEEIIACLPTDRTLFTYFKDQYAVYLLEQQLRDGRCSIKKLRASPLRKLLEKPLIKQVLRDCGDGELKEQQLWMLGVPDASQYVLTLGKWGEHFSYRWGQTSRPGVNLVLQLNLPNQIDSVFQALMGCPISDITPFSHPYSDKRPATLAWARLDLDFRTGELLIEEIQSDLIRIVARLKQRALASGPIDGHYCHWGARRINREAAIRFCDDLLIRQKNLWAEAMLAASLWFAQKELGLHRIFYHTYETGCLVKNIHQRRPPRSLYTELPEQFCFTRTRQAPEFILANHQARRRIRKAADAEWYLLTH